MLNTYIKAALLGIVAGMRSMTAPALVSDRYNRVPSLWLVGSRLHALGTAKTATGLKIAAAGELIADKLPFTPARTAPGALVARAVSGSVCGATICTADDQPAATGAIIGGVAAVLSAFAFYHLRRSLGKRLNVPDAVIALAEDALAVGGGWAVLNTNTGD